MIRGPAVTVAEMKHAFDASFALPAANESEAHADLLLIRAQENSICVRLAQIAGILRCPPLTALPSRNRALAGLAGIRGNVVVVYRLGMLLGESASATGSFILTCAQDPSVALLFDELSSYIRLPLGSIHATEDGSTWRDSDVATIGRTNHGVLSIPSLLETIRQTSRTEVRPQADKE